MSKIFGCPNTEPQHMMEKWESWDEGILVCECGKRFQIIDCKIVPIENQNTELESENATKRTTYRKN